MKYILLFAGLVTGIVSSALAQQTNYIGITSDIYKDTASAILSSAKPLIEDAQHGQKVHMFDSGGATVLQHTVPDVKNKHAHEKATEKSVGVVMNHIARNYSKTAGIGALNVPEIIASVEKLYQPGDNLFLVGSMLYTANPSYSFAKSDGSGGQIFYRPSHAHLLDEYSLFSTVDRHDRLNGLKIYWYSAPNNLGDAGNENRKGIENFWLLWLTRQGAEVVVIDDNFSTVWEIYTQPKNGKKPLKGKLESSEKSLEMVLADNKPKQASVTWEKPKLPVITKFLLVDRTVSMQPYTRMVSEKLSELPMRSNALYGLVLYSDMLSPSGKPAYLFDEASSPSALSEALLKIPHESGVDEAEDLALGLMKIIEVAEARQLKDFTIMIFSDSRAKNANETSHKMDYRTLLFHLRQNFRASIQFVKASEDQNTTWLARTDVEIIEIANL